MNSMEEILTREMDSQGLISFARFMELALYCPKTGYYEQPSRGPGAAGDFFTNASVGTLFGELLACYFSSWMQAQEGDRLQIVEAGAHDGAVARDILGWVRSHRPQLYERVEYVILEPSELLAARQRATLEGMGTTVRWVSGPEELEAQSINGVIFSNELLDAMPVHRLGWSAAEGDWFEWGVGRESDRFVWKRMPGAGGAWQEALREAGFDLSPELLKSLPDGYILEISPKACMWWECAAQALKRGKLMTVDYGYTAEELLRPERTGGTLRAYHRHQSHRDVLEHPGEQDLTAHVNLTQIRRIGEREGLATEMLVWQEQFLARLLQQGFEKESSFRNWSPAEARQFKTLTHPSYLGRVFRVLVQGR